MKKNIRRVLAAFLMAALVLTSQPGIVRAVDTNGDESAEGWSAEFDEETGTMTISGTGECVMWEQPSYAESVKKLVIGEGITSISCYYNYESKKHSFPNITQVVFPDSLKEIGQNTFYGCAKLTEVVFPQTLDKIGEGAFCECTGLQKVVLNEGLKNIDNFCFNKCTGLTEIEIPQSVTELGESVFSQCEKLQKVVLNEGLKKIGNYCFNSCFVLEGITLPQSVEVLGSSVFNTCSQLTEIEIPGLVKEVGDHIFFQCKKLQKVVLHEGLERVGEAAFYSCDKLKEIEIPQTVKVIDVGAFSNCSKLEKVVLHEGLERLGSVRETSWKGCFWECTSLTSIQIPSTVKEIGSYMFYCCFELPPITLHEGLEKLGDEALPPKEIKKIVLPASLTYIGEENFSEDWHCFVMCKNEEQIAYCQENNLEYENAAEGIDLSGCQVTLEKTQVEYTGKETQPRVSEVLYSGEHGSCLLTEGTDYLVSYENNVDCGTATAVLTGIGAWKGKKETNYVIYRSIGSCDINLAYQEVLYNGQKQDPEVVVKYGDETLVPDEDYSLTYRNDINEGTATVTITGKGNYQGSVEKQYTIYKKQLADCNISQEYTSVVYDGSAKRPTVTVKSSDGTLLTEGTDYLVTYLNDTEPGTATIQVTGQGIYTGEKLLSYTIEKISLESAAATLNETIFTYDGSEKKPVVTVVLGGKTLTQGVEFSVTYEANVNEGTAYAVVQGIGYYTGTFRMSYTILPYSAGMDSVYSKDDTLISKNLLYHITDEEEGEVEISSTSNKSLKQLVIPATVTCDGKTYKVTSIGKNAFYKNTKLTSIVIGNNVTSIEDYAFYGCKNVTSIKMGKSVEIIGASSFRKCTKLKSIVLPKSMDELGKNAFYGCKKLSTITIQSNSVVDIADNAIKGISNKAVIKVPKKLIKSYKKELGKKTGYKKTMKIKKK